MCRSDAGPFAHPRASAKFRTIYVNATANPIATMNAIRYSGYTMGIGWEGTPIKDLLQMWFVIRGRVNNRAALVIGKQRTVGQFLSARIPEQNNARQQAPFPSLGVSWSLLESLGRRLDV